MRSLLCVLLFAVLGAAGVICPASAQTYHGTGTWSVTINTAVSSCFAESGSGGRSVQLGLEAGDLSIVIFDEKLAWVKDKQEYSAQFVVDRARWDGTLFGVSANGASGLGLRGLNGEFGDAIAAGSQLLLVVDGATFGPYSLKGSRGALTDLTNCLREMEAPKTQATPKNGRVEPAGQLVGWDVADVGRPIRVGSLNLLLTAIDETTLDATVENERGRVASFRLTAAPGRGGQVGLLPLGQYANSESLIVTSFTGGAHCCLEVTAVVPDGDHYRVTELGSYNADQLDVEDIDADGTLELLVPDERFLQFDGFAGSFPPRLIYKTEEGAPLDVSGDERYAAAHRKTYVQQSNACALTANVNRGACAGLLGSAARLGLFEATVHFLDFDTPEESPWEQSICIDERCTERRDFPNLKEAVLFSLPRWGYTGPSLSDDFKRFVDLVAGQTFGSGETESSCGDFPVSMQRATGALGSEMLDIVEYESGCIVSGGLVLGTTLYTEAVCQGEGSPAWLEQRLISIDGSRLGMANLPTSMSEPGRKNEMTRCEIDKTGAN